MRLRTWHLSLCSTILLLCGGCGNSNGNSSTPPPTAASHFAYVSNSDSSNITAYKMDSASGGLSAVSGSPFGGVDAPLGLALNPSADLLAAGNLNGGRISVFRVNKTSGAITPVAGSPFSTTGGGFPARSVFHTSGKFLYTGLMLNATSDISGFAVDSTTGALTPLAGSPFPGQAFTGGGAVESLAVHLAGTFLYASGFFTGITGYAVDNASGELAQLAGSPFSPAGTFFHSTLVVHPSGKFLYMADFDVDGVRVFPIAADGSLGAEITGSPLVSGTGARDIALDPSGKFAYVVNDGDTNVAAFSVNATSGELTLIGNVDTGISPFALTVDSSGKFLYVTNQTDGNVSAYAINSATGALATVAGSPFPAANSPISIVATK
jgi:6-phosphogluconolactonase (cycloisomerase 2 family)